MACPDMSSLETASIRIFYHYLFYSTSSLSMSVADRKNARKKTTKARGLGREYP